MRKLPRRWAWILAGLGLAAVTACGRAPEPLRLSGPTMGTTYSIVVPVLPDGVAGAQVEAVVTGVLREADACLSSWNPESELSRFNRSGSTHWQPVSAALLETVAQARLVSEATDGAFDITVGPLVAAWGFGAGSAAAVSGQAPTAATLAGLRAETGFGKLEHRAGPAALRKTVPGLVIDVDGIAPGWVVDRIAVGFEALGIRDYLVELGGEVRARGLNPGQRAWRIAIETPVAGERRVQGVIELDGSGVSTSGDYRDYREIDGRRVSHTIDPRTGLPVAHGLASVTVVAASAALADAWSTALMVLGPREGLEVARQQGLAALFIVRGAGPGEFVEHETPEFTRLRRPAAAGL